MRFPFTTGARTQLRAMDRATALRILEALTRYGEAQTGDVSPRLEIIAVGHRSDIYK